MKSTKMLFDVFHLGNAQIGNVLVLDASGELVLSKRSSEKLEWIGLNGESLATLAFLLLFYCLDPIIMTTSSKKLMAKLKSHTE